MEREPQPGRKRWRVYRAPTKPVAGEPGEPSVPDPDDLDRPRGKVSATPSARTTRGVGIAVLVVVGIVVVGVIGIAVLAIVAATTDEGPFGTSEVQVLTEDGVADLVDAIEEETGSTEVFSATIYPTYAVVRVPADRTSQREIGYYWDGHDFEPWSSKGTSSNQRIDLAEVDVAVLLPLVREAKAQVEDANSWYVIIGHDATDDGWISAYASNEYNEGGYIEVDRTGKEIRRVGWPTEP